MKSECGPVRIRRREFIGGRKMGSDKKYENEGQNQCSNRPLAVVEFEAQISQRQQPAKQRHGSVEIMIRNRVCPLRSLEQDKVMHHQASGQQQRSQPAGKRFSGVQKDDIQRETQRVSNDRRNEKAVVHSSTLYAGEPRRTNSEYQLPRTAGAPERWNASSITYTAGDPHGVIEVRVLGPARPVKMSGSRAARKGNDGPNIG